MASIEPVGAVTIPAGGTVEIEVKADGFSGFIQGFATMAYPPVAGQKDWTYGEPREVEIGRQKGTGTFTVTLELGPARTDIAVPFPLAKGELGFKIESLDAAGNVGGGEFGPFDVTITAPAGAAQPANDGKDALDELWALAGGFRANKDTTNAEYIESRVIRLKTALGL